MNWTEVRRLGIFFLVGGLILMAGTLAKEQLYWGLTKLIGISNVIPHLVLGGKPALLGITAIIAFAGCVLYVAGTAIARHKGTRISS